jgi:hypothetical protein
MCFEIYDKHQEIMFFLLAFKNDINSLLLRLSNWIIIHDDLGQFATIVSNLIL